jgi:uncharacterized protein
MIDSLMSVDGGMTAFVAGLVTSLHCAAMCGPIALLLAPRAGETHSFLSVTAIYHGTRICAITLGGVLAGTLGMVALEWTQLYQSTVVHYLPWLLVVFFLLLALRLDRVLPQSPWMGGLWGRLTRRFFRLPRPVGAAAAGLFTPFLPCGPLYLVFGLALMSQSPVRGAEFLLAFGLGTLPLLWLAQQQYHFWQRRISPRLIDRVQRGIALLAAIVIAVRLVFFEATSGGLFCG